MKFGEDLSEVDEAFADENLFAKFVGVGGPAAILGMDAAHMGTEDVDRIHRVGLAVEEEVGGIEADAEVGHGYIVYGAGHRGGCFLAGFHEEVLAVGLAMFGHGADGFDGLRVEGIAGVFWDEAAVGLYLGNADLLGEVGNLAEGVDARGAGFGGHHADGGWSLHEVPFQWRRAYDLDGGGDELVLGEQIAILAGQGRGEVADVLVER